MFRSVNPATEEVLGEFPEHSALDIENALARAAVAFTDWQSRSFQSRGELFRTLAGLLERDAERAATIIAKEMGKPLPDGVLEVKKCASGCRYFADHASEYLTTEKLRFDGEAVSLTFQPMGPLLAVMPWNYPFWQLFRFAAPAMMAGNVVILKHAPNVPQCAQAIEALFREAGFPDGALQSLFLGNDDTLRIIGDRRIRGVTLTGSPRAGREVGMAAGRHLKPLVLELGGSDPFIVLADAELEKAVDAAITAKNTNNGQVCISAKRFLVHRDRYSEFVDRFSEKMRERRLGDPLRPETQNGPMAREDLRAALEEQVRKSIACGARVVAEGRIPDGPGYFYAPTVLENVQPGSPAYDEELFGPVASVFPFTDDDEAVRLANDTVYGLGATVWTETPAHAERLVPRIDAGQVFVNGLVRSDPRLPFGGIKDSGFGRELGREGIRHFTHLKTVVVR